jgi:S1 RNA binding domain protein
MSLEIGSIVEGTVTGVTNFGAFVKLPEGNTGLIHISEVANTYVKEINSYLKEKDVIMVKVLGINDKGKYDLSLKQAILELSDEEVADAEKGEVVYEDLNGENTEKIPQKRREEYRNNQQDRKKTANYGYSEDKRDNRYENKDFSFEDKLSKFLKQSEERLLDIKRNTESKRGRKR